MSYPYTPGNEAAAVGALLRSGLRPGRGRYRRPGLVVEVWRFGGGHGLRVWEPRHPNGRSWTWRPGHGWASCRPRGSAVADQFGGPPHPRVWEALAAALAGPEGG